MANSDDISADVNFFQIQHLEATIAGASYRVHMTWHSFGMIVRMDI